MINIFKRTIRWIVILIILVLLMLSFLAVFSPLFTSLDPSSSERAMNATRKSNLDSIYYEIESYYDDNDYFPTSLSELEKFVESKTTGDEIKKLPKDPETGEDYLYAYYPAENPTAYHLGVILEIKDDKDLNDDSDFNSKAAGYVNGFDGKDPVFDVHMKN